MKRNLIVALILAVGFSLTANAQLGKIKVKTPKVKTPKVKVKNPISTTSSSTSGGEVAKEAAKTKEMENECADLIAAVQAMFASKEATNQRTSKEIEDALYKVKSKLSTIKNYYKMSQRIDEFQADYDKYKKMADAEFALRESVDDIRYGLENYSKYAEAAKSDFKASGFGDNFGAYPDYKKFEEYKATYKNSGKPEADLDTYIANVDNYFDNTLPSKAGEVKKYMLEKACSGAFDEAKWKKAPSSGIKNIDYQLEKFEKMYLRVKDAAWVDALKAELTAQKTKLEKYISSGDFEAYKAAERKKIVDARRMDKPYKKDAAMEGLVKKYHNSAEYGTLKRVIITSDWYVVKNDLGIPLEKKMAIQVVVSKDGVCDIRDGKLFKQYEGGGTYGKIKLSHYFTPAEINCDNIFK